MGSSSSSSPKMSEDIVREIKVLLISDIHLNVSNIQRVHRYLVAHKIKVDHLWAPGDFMKLKDADNDDEKKRESAEQSMVELLSEIKKIHPNPVIIPGNHDPKTLFNAEDERYHKFGECVNIHSRLHRVEGESNLFMAGFGGSVPALCANEVHWTGYPFVDEAAFNKEYEPFIEGVIGDDRIETAKSVVLFTHNGPAMSSTTMDWRLKDENKVILMGSQSVTKSLLNEKLSDKLICNIHGHTHLGVGQGFVGDVRVINPGSLKGGNFNHNFALLDLVQSKDQTWKVDGVQFKSVSSFD